MHWSQNSVNNLLREAAELIDDAVTMVRNRGYTREKAIDQASVSLGMSKRRVKSFLYGEAICIAIDEYQKLKDRFLDHLDNEADHLAQRSAAVRLRRKQMEQDRDVGNSS